MQIKPILSVILSSVLVFSSVLQAGPMSLGHAISLSDLRSEISSRNSDRESSIQEIRFLIAHAQAHPISHLVPLERVLVILPSLDDSKLEYLARESRRVNDQIRAGMIVQEKESGGPVLVACDEGEILVEGKCVPDDGKPNQDATVGIGNNADPREAKKALERMRLEQERVRHEEEIQRERERRQEAARQAEERQRESVRQAEEQARQLDESIRQSQEQQAQRDAQIEQTSQELGQALAGVGIGTILLVGAVIVVVLVVMQEAEA